MTSDISVGYQGLPIENLAQVLNTAQGSFLNASNGLSYTDNTWIISVLDKYRAQLISTNTPPGVGDSPSLVTLDDFFSQLNRSNSYTIDQFAQSFINAFIHNNSVYNTPPEIQALEDNLSEVLRLLVKANLGVMVSSTEAAQVDTDISSVLGTGIGINASAPLDAASLNTRGTGVYTSAFLNNIVNSLDPRFPSTFTDDIANKAFTEALKSSAFSDLNTPSGAGLAQAIKSDLENYFVRFAFIPDYINAFLAYSQDPSNVASNSLTITNQLKDFISNILSTDPSTTFRSSAEFGSWLQQLSNNYQASIYGTTITTSSVGASMPKVRIIQRIYALIVEMIMMLQRTTASQSQYLKVLTLQQSMMTNLISKTHVFTSTDGSPIAVTGTTVTDAQAHRDELNQVVSAWVDGIRARRDFTKNEAQSAQSYLNNSNDAVNQQASMATALIQELSTLLGAIYR